MLDKNLTERLERQLSRETELRNTLEQYTRKDNIKIINFPNDSDTETADSTEKKVLDFMQNTPGLRNFTAHYVSVAHRVGKYRQKQNRPVIVRLTNRKVKTDIFKQRKKLKESNQTVFINEDLTKLNSQRLYRIKQHPAVMSGWSFQGKLYCKLLNLQVIGIEDGDLDKIDRVLLDSPNTDQLREQSQWRQDRGGPRGRGGRRGVGARGGRGTGVRGSGLSYNGRDQGPADVHSRPCQKAGNGQQERREGGTPGDLGDPAELSQERQTLEEREDLSLDCDSLTDKTADRRQLLSNVSREECMEETTETDDVFPPVSNAKDDRTGTSTCQEPTRQAECR